MRQRHSFCRLACHLVCSTKHRLPFLETEEECDTLLCFMEMKARELDCFVEERGGWREHIHLLVQWRSTVRLSELYGQMKGLSATMWRRRFPDRPFKWEDGVFAKSVDPDRADDLRRYIRDQWSRHESGLLIPELEP
jgi:putative transposase